MYYIKLEDDMSLVTTVWEPIYRGDNLSRKITYLIPRTVGEVDMLQAAVYLSMIRADGDPDIVLLDRQEELYKDRYFQYTIPVTCRLSRYAGEVLTWLQICSGATSPPVIAKSGENIIRVTDSRDTDACIGSCGCNRILTALYQSAQKNDKKIAEVSEKMAEIEERVDALMAERADGLTFDPVSGVLQLTSEGTPVGNKVFVSTSDGRKIVDISISDDGELLVLFSDGSSKNAGRVRTGGVVYVPHIDANKTLTFSIETEASGIPDPVSLGAEEWGGIDDADVATAYTWGSIGG